MKSGGWPSIGLIYLFGVLAAASLTKVIPLQQDLTTHVGMSAAQFALLLSLLSIPAALTATVVGSVIDRVGARSALIVAAAAGALANLLFLAVDTPRGFLGVRLFEGLIMVGVYSAAPALIMATASNERRGRAMALWSTYTPVGVSLGLLLSGTFAGTEAWRGGFAAHAVLFALLAVAGVLLPRPAQRGGAAGPRPGLLAAWAQPGPLKVALLFGTLVLTGFGVNSVYPSWYAQQEDVTLGAASGVLGVLNLTMIAGGALTAIVLARGLRHHHWYTVLVAAGLVAAFVMFWPATAQVPRLSALVCWLVVSGASVAVVTAMLPRVVANPLQGAAAAGLLSQVAALTTFFTPQVWLPILATGRWPLFLAVIAAAGIAGILLFPRPRDER